MPNEEDIESPPTPPPADTSPWRPLLNPVVFIVLLLLFSINFFITAAIFGWDKILLDMGKIEFARGLITYLFAVVTIGTAVVLVVSALTAADTKLDEHRFQRGKEILGLLLGIFGTIVGFYFGSEVTQKPSSSLLVAPISLDSMTTSPGGHVRLESHVSGGQPPYKYAISLDDDPVPQLLAIGANGWIDKSLTAPSVTAEKTVEVHLFVRDSSGEKVDESSLLTVRPQ